MRNSTEEREHTYKINSILNYLGKEGEEREIYAQKIEQAFDRIGGINDELVFFAEAFKAGYLTHTEIITRVNKSALDNIPDNLRRSVPD